MTHDLGISSCLGIESSQLQACLQEARTRPYHGVFGFPGFGFAEDHLDFLRELPWLHMVWFWDVELRSVEGLYALEHLRYIGVHPKRPALDFARFPDLETVIWTFNPRDRGLATLDHLKRFHIWHYNPRSRSFAGVAIPPQLEELELNWANPPTLDGLPFMPHLRRLEIARCRNLASLATLPTLAPHLEHLHIQACGRVTSAMGEEILRRLPELREAFVQDRWLIGPARPVA